MIPNRNRAPLLLLALAIAVTLLPGCGGNRNEANPATASTSATTLTAPRTTGRAVVTITWPKRDGTRLIPTATNSLRIDVLRNGAVIATQLVTRPTDGQPSTLTFKNLPIGTLSVAAHALPGADGSGVAQAQETAPLTTIDGQTVNFRIVMDSTVDHIGVSPPTATLLVGQTQVLIATAYNTDGAIVLIAPSKTTWLSSDGSVSVDTDGVVKGESAGVATITATETESGKTATATVTVQTPTPPPPPTATPTPTPTPPPTPADGSTRFPQFSPRDSELPMTQGRLRIDNPGFPNSGVDCTLDTDKATLVRDDTKEVLATGTLVTQTFPTVRTRVTYAVFNFKDDVYLKVRMVFTGGNPVVFLTQGSFTLDTSAIYPTLDTSDVGPGGQIKGPGGATFGGRGGHSIGGGGTVADTYGADFADGVKRRSHLQGGSSTIAFDNTITSGGGAIYIGSVGVLTIRNSTISCEGAWGTNTYGDANGYGAPNASGGGSGGGIALFGQGGVNLDKMNLFADGGRGGAVQKSADSKEGLPGGGGGGGCIAIFYGPGTDFSLRYANVSLKGGVAGISNGHDPAEPGEDGTLTTGVFNSF